MLRREARLRKEFLYRKALEEKEKSQHDNVRRLKEALDSNKPIPRDLRSQATELTKAMTYEAGVQPNFDDEYSTAGLRDPKILITTSRNPSNRLLQFAKELRLVFPNSQRINRGGHVIADVVSACKSNEVTDLIILHENRGVPDGMIVSHFPHGPTAFFSLSNVLLRHDVPESQAHKVSEAYPHLIFSGFSTKIGLRTQNILKYLFPVPKEDSRRTITFVNREDFVSFRHHTFVSNRAGGGKEEDIELTEVGPRFELRLFQIRQGTVDITEADIEWVLRPYINTAKKSKIL